MSGGNGYSVSYDGSKAIFMPRSPRKKRGVILCHPVGGNGAVYGDSVTLMGGVQVASTLASNGIICIASAVGGTDAWANDAAMTAITSDFATLVSLGCASDKFCAYGISMGHAAPTRYAALHPGSVAAVYGTAPVCDINDIWQNKRVGNWAAIGTSWSAGTWPAALPANADLISQAPAETGIPWRLDYGTQDAVCQPATVQALAAALGSSCTATVVDTTNPHGAALFAKTNPQDVFNLFVANGA